MALPLIDQLRLEDEFRSVPLAEIWMNPLNPRQRFEPEALAELVESVKAHGILEPLLLTPNPDELGGYLVVCGERRRQAAVRAKLLFVPAIIREMDETTQLQVMLTENIIRSDLDPVEEARGLQRLLDECGMTQAELGQRLGKSQPWISNRLRLLRLPETVLAKVESGELSAGHAQVLLQYESAPKTVEAAAAKIIKGKIPVTDVGAKAIQATLDQSEHRTLSEYNAAFDVKTCKGCEHDKTPGWVRICLNPECYDRKQAEAIAAKRAELQAQTGGETTAALRASGMEFVNQWQLQSVKDAECETCPKRKMLAGDQDRVEEVCLDPACFKAKDEAKRQATEAAKREKNDRRRQTVLAAADTVRDGFETDHLVFLLLALLRTSPTRKDWQIDVPERDQLLGSRFGKKWPIDDAYNQDLGKSPKTAELIEYLKTRKPGQLRAAIIEWALASAYDYMGPALDLVGVKEDKPAETAADDEDPPFDDGADDYCPAPDRCEWWGGVEGCQCPDDECPFDADEEASPQV